MARKEAAVAKQTKPQRPRGYWDDETNIERELRELIQKYGKFPSFGTMVRDGESALCNAVSKGRKISYWRAKLSQVLPQKPAGYWTEETVERALREWVAEHGSYPTDTDLARTDHNDLRAAIRKHGGYVLWNTRIGGVKATQWPSYWKNEANVEAELRRWIQEHGRFPTKSDLSRSRHSSLAAAITATLGVPEWRTRLGYPASAPRPGYWLDEENIERELRLLINALGRFPSRTAAAAHGKGSLFGAMQRVHGIDFWYERVQHGRSAKKPGYWQDEANVERELKEWVAAHGRFPTQNDLVRTRKTSLNTAIIRTGGLPAWRTRLGYDLIRKNRGYWEDEANIERELRAWIARHGRFPSDKALLKTGDNGLRSMITRKKDGIAYWRAKLGYGPITPVVLREHADVLARVVMTLDVADTTSFWRALQDRWTMCDLTEAIREYEQEGKLERFRELLAAAD